MIMLWLVNNRSDYDINLQPTNLLELKVAPKKRLQKHRSKKFNSQNSTSPLAVVLRSITVLTSVSVFSA